MVKGLCIKTKLKKDHIEEIRHWFRDLNERMDEVLESLENEKIFVESAFLDMQGDDLYLIYYIKAEDIAYAYRVFEHSVLQIDVDYKACWRKYCEGRVVLETLLDVDRFSKL
ncbi:MULTISPECIES: DUF6176 family protein [Parachlamydia]|jgi:protease II|uniref:DUF6176 family protein n=1 Tax=Parachlamydia TaxID=83551 RepID=UPI000303AB0E|nr:DUF6176 family protein [Parachlamydia acanthamoebae]